MFLDWTLYYIIDLDIWLKLVNELHTKKVDLTLNELMYGSQFLPANYTVPASTS